MNRRSFFRSLLAAPVAAVLPMVPRANEGGFPVPAEFVTALSARRSAQVTQTITINATLSAADVARLRGVLEMHWAKNSARVHELMRRRRL